MQMKWVLSFAILLWAWEGVVAGSCSGPGCGSQVISSSCSGPQCGGVVRETCQGPSCSSTRIRRSCQGPNCLGGEGAAPAPAPGQSTFMVPSGGHRYGNDGSGRQLENVLLSGGSPVAGRAEDGVFKDLIVNEGLLGFRSNGIWQQFPLETRQDLLRMIQGNPALASSEMGRQILAAYDELGESVLDPSLIPEESVMSSNSSRSELRGDILLSPNEPIRGRGRDGVFRPIAFRSNGEVGFWDGGWQPLPDQTLQDLRSHLANSGRQNEGPAQWLGGDEAPALNGPGSEPVDFSAPRPIGGREVTNPSVGSHGSPEILDETTGGRPIDRSPRRVFSLEEHLLRLGSVDEFSLQTILEEDLAKYGLTKESLGRNGWSGVCKTSPGVGNFEFGETSCVYTKTDPIFGDLAFRLKETGWSPFADFDPSNPAGIIITPVEPGRVLRFEDLGLGAPSPESLQALRDRVRTDQLHVLFTSYANPGEPGYCQPCQSFKGPFNSFVNQNGDMTFVTIDASSYLQVDEEGSSVELPSGLKRLFQESGIMNGDDRSGGVPSGMIFDRNGGGWSRTNLNYQDFVRDQLR